MYGTWFFSLCIYSQSSIRDPAGWHQKGLYEALGGECPKRGNSWNARNPFFPAHCCLHELWTAVLFPLMIFLLQVPDKARVTPSSSDPIAKFYELIKVSIPSTKKRNAIFSMISFWLTPPDLTLVLSLFLLQSSDVDSFQSKVTALSSSTLEKVHQVLNFRCIVGGGEQNFLLSLGVSGSPGREGRHSHSFSISSWSEPLNMTLTMSCLCFCCVQRHMVSSG